VVGFTALCDIKVEDILEFDVPKYAMKILVRSWDKLDKLLITQTLFWTNESTNQRKAARCTSDRTCSDLLSRVRKRWLYSNWTFQPSMLLEDFDYFFTKVPDLQTGDVFCSSCRANLEKAHRVGCEGAWKQVEWAFK
jgi:hypothetical protein